MLSRLYKITAIICAVVLLFSSCSGSKENEKTKVNSGGAIALQMRIPDSLNPLDVKNQSVADALSLCYEPLFTVNDKLEPEGILARSIILSDDCMSAIVTLKDSAKWHDGVKFTSADVVHTINLLKENKYTGYADCTKHIESVQSIDPLSLKITLSRPYGQIAYSLRFPIVASHNVNIEENIIGTGPYMAERYSPAAELDLKRFEEWHGGETLCDNITVWVIRDNETATSAFNTGKINAITDKSYDLYNSSPRENARTTLYPSAEYEFLAFNHRRKPFNSQAVRVAVSSATDRMEIVREAYQMAANEVNSPIHPEASSVASASVASQYNLANANEMLFLEGYFKNESTGILEKKNGEKLSFTILVNEENPRRVKTAQILRTQLFAAGIEVYVKECSFEEYCAKISRGEYDAYLGGTMLSNLYDFEMLFSEDGNLNKFGYESEFMGLALSALSCAPTSDSLKDATANFEEIFLREQPVCGLLYKKSTLITSENIMGKLMPAMGFPYGNIARWSIKK